MFLTTCPKQRLVWWLCVVAALRVFTLAGSFPFFNNVDEDMHFDTVLRYSRGEIPWGLSRVSAEAARYIVIYGSPEYLSTTSEHLRVPPPVWRQSRDRINGSLELEMDVCQSKLNHESASPPLYYALAGAWLKAGQLAGLRDATLLYWIRFLNILLVVALVWLGYLAAEGVFPESRFICLGLPALVAVWPQDYFYSIQSDVLSPVCFGLALVAMLRWSKAEKADAKFAGLAGLALAAGCMVKISNLPLLAIGTAGFLCHAWWGATKGARKNTEPSVGWFLLFVLGPMVVLLTWNLHVYGDPTGAGIKTQALGWTRKPFADWWSHPLFTPGGVWTFWQGLMATFWRGECVWRGEPMSRPAVDTFYYLSSALFIGLAVASLFRPPTTAARGQRQTLGLCIASVAGCVLFLGALSVIYDFGECPYPSRAYPYFASGRLLSGAAIPLMLLYLRGLDWMLCRQKERTKWLALTGIILLMALSELVYTFPVFSSQYNWFHL